ncbi:hypothetical protein Leryth_026843 [Lithospermum erythrorhizon]|nr:hypothetical protein Leryth_026843 [Lithospermum erythrorhizon]
MNLKEIVLRSNIYELVTGLFVSWVLDICRILPVRVNHSIHSYGNGNENKRYFFSKYGQMGVYLKEALHEASEFD